VCSFTRKASEDELKSLRATKKKEWKATSGASEEDVVLDSPNTGTKDLKGKRENFKSARKKRKIIEPM
jgi:hypothetical protein